MYTINCTTKALIAWWVLIFLSIHAADSFFDVWQRQQGSFFRKMVQKGVIFLHSHSNTTHQPFPNNHCPINHPPKPHNSSTLYAFLISYISSLLNTFSVPDFSNRGHFYNSVIIIIFEWYQYARFIIVYYELIPNTYISNRG